jgi:hypothetical protein
MNLKAKPVQRPRRGIARTWDDYLDVQFFVPVSTGSPMRLSLLSSNTYRESEGGHKICSIGLPNPTERREEHDPCIEFGG